MWTWHIEKGLSQEQQGQYSKHIYLGETRIVTKQTSDLEEHYGQSEEKRHQYYYHPDHLGSAQLVTDFEGNEYQRIEYTPYGELWVEKKTAHEKDMRYLPYKFTAKEQDEETGLYYYGARYLDAKYSRWLSADPAVGEYMSGSSAGGGIYDSINFNLYHYAGNNPIKYTDPTGMWKNNGDGTFTAEKDDTLWGLQQETGKDWHESNWDKKRDPRTLQIGETVDMGKRTSKPDDAITVSNTDEARKLYLGGNKSAVWLSDEIFDAVKNGPVTTLKINDRIKTGATELAEGDWGEDLTNIKGMWFMGKTNVDYKIYTGTTTSIVDLTAFVRDGCWDVLPGKGDGIGPQKEIPFGSPYPFIERSWSISFPNPRKMNWR